LRDFLANEAVGGIVLIAAAALAMIAANSGLAGAYFGMLHYETGPVLAPAIGPMTVHLWINDALMAIFFPLVGLEIKRELVDGQLASAERRRLPIIAAAGPFRRRRTSPLPLVCWRCSARESRHRSSCS